MKVTIKKEVGVEALRQIVLLALLETQPAASALVGGVRVSGGSGIACLRD